MSERGSASEREREKELLACDCLLALLALLDYSTVMNCFCWFGLVGGDWTDVVAAAAADESFADVLLNFDSLTWSSDAMRCDASEEHATCYLYLL